MLTEQHLINQWLQLKSQFSESSTEELVPLFAIEILRKYGWPYKPSKIQDSLPPLNQTFLGYYPEVGWLLDFWRPDYVPLDIDTPTHWLSMNVLPNPSFL